MKYYLHETPGRLRIKIPGLKGNAQAVEAVREELMDLAGVREVNANAVTGSIIVIHHRDALQTRDVLDLLEEQGHIDAASGAPTAVYNDQAFSKAGAAVGKALFGMAVERALAPTGLSFLAALI